MNQAFNAAHSKISDTYPQISLAQMKWWRWDMSGETLVWTSCHSWCSQLFIVWQPEVSALARQTTAPVSTPIIFVIELAISPIAEYADSGYAVLQCLQRLFHMTQRMRTADLLQAAKFSQGLTSGKVTNSLSASCSNNALCKSGAKCLRAASLCLLTVMPVQHQVVKCSQLRCIRSYRAGFHIFDIAIWMQVVLLFGFSTSCTFDPCVNCSHDTNRMYAVALNSCFKCCSMHWTMLVHFELHPETWLWAVKQASRSCTVNCHGQWFSDIHLPLCLP